MIIPNKQAGDILTHEEINQPFWVKSAIYDGVNDRIIITIGPGRADWGNGNLTEKLSDSTFYITSPNTETTYYVFIKNDSTFIYSTSEIPGEGEIRLASIAVGNTKDALTIHDLRGMLSVGVQMTPSEILEAVKTVDGAGSGLDADLLDGKEVGHASGDIPISDGTLCSNLNADQLHGKTDADFALASHNHDSTYIKLSGGNPTGTIDCDAISTARLVVPVGTDQWAT